jgi:hypothetical protein
MAMAVRLILAVLGLFHLINGLIMLAFPAEWAGAVVHLPAPDHLHIHFIVDIGLVFAASGMGMIWGSRPGAAVWAAAGSVWPVLHGLFHAVEWVTDGLPRGMDFFKEGVGVILAGALGAALAFRRYRKGEV